jgi:pimeloyl-ACP methyl ester carboxylesterase
LLCSSRSGSRPKDLEPPPSSPQEIARRLYAHPERMAAIPAPDPAVVEKHRRLVLRLGGPARDADLETRMKTLAIPTLVLFGTEDRVIPPELGRLYRELMPNAHLAFVYDAGHAIAAERPEAFTEIVADFLERHEAFVVSRTPTVIHP